MAGRDVTTSVIKVDMLCRRATYITVESNKLYCHAARLIQAVGQECPSLSSDTHKYADPNDTLQPQAEIHTLRLCGAAAHISWDLWSH